MGLVSKVASVTTRVDQRSVTLYRVLILESLVVLRFRELERRGKKRRNVEERTPNREKKHAEALNSVTRSEEGGAQRSSSLAGNVRFT